MKSVLIRGSVESLRKIALVLIVAYQKIISPFTRPSCRFYPTCSEYARLAVEKYGIIKGGSLALLRIVKCHPFHPGGVDPLR